VIEIGRIERSTVPDQACLAVDGRPTPYQGFLFTGRTTHGELRGRSGWEYVDGLDLIGEAPRVAGQAAALVRADECPSGEMTIVLDGDQVALQVHE